MLPDETMMLGDLGLAKIIEDDTRRRRAEMATVLTRGLSKDPADRYPHVTDWATEAMAALVPTQRVEQRVERSRIGGRAHDQARRSVRVAGIARAGAARVGCRTSRPGLNLHRRGGPPSPCATTFAPQWLGGLYEGPYTDLGGDHPDIAETTLVCCATGWG